MRRKKPKQIFISHSAKDRDFVEREIISLLDSHRINVWYSKDDIQTASQWQRSIVDGLKSCDWFLVVISPRSVSSKWVRAEVDWAFQHRMDHFVPVVFESCEWDDFNLLLRTIQHVDFSSDPHDARIKLLKTWGIEGVVIPPIEPAQTEASLNSIANGGPGSPNQSRVVLGTQQNHFLRYRSVVVAFLLLGVLFSWHLYHKGHQKPLKEAISKDEKPPATDAKPNGEDVIPKSSIQVVLAPESSTPSPLTTIQDVANQIKDILSGNSAIKGQKVAIGNFDGTDAKARRSRFGVELRRQLTELLHEYVDDESDYTLSGGYSCIGGNLATVRLSAMIKLLGKPVVSIADVEMRNNSPMSLEDGLQTITHSVAVALADNPLLMGKKIAMGQVYGEGPKSKDSEFGVEIQRRLANSLHEQLDDDSDFTLVGILIYEKLTPKDEQSEIIHLIVTVKHLGKDIVCIPHVEINTPEDVNRILKWTTFDGTNDGETKELAPGITFRWCPSGKFMMAEEVRAELIAGFWLGETEVTQGQWENLMGSKPWSAKDQVNEGDDFPASHVSYGDAVSMCKNLTEREHHIFRLPKKWKYSLPSEAQWEYACRAGSHTRFSFGDDASKLGEYGWFYKNVDKPEYAQRVGQKKANGWGLLDMHGNVWEWCGDWLDPKLKSGRDPVGPPMGSDRVIRGGSWGSLAEYCSTVNRGSSSPDERNSYLGFRLAAFHE